MRKQLETIAAKLAVMIERAEELSGSDNDETADKYADVLDALQGALACIDDGIATFEGV